MPKKGYMTPKKSKRIQIGADLVIEKIEKEHATKIDFRGAFCEEYNRRAIEENVDILSYTESLETGKTNDGVIRKDIPYIEERVREQSQYKRFEFGKKIEKKLTLELPKTVRNTLSSVYIGRQDRLHLVYDSQKSSTEPIDSIIASEHYDTLDNHDLIHIYLMLSSRNQHVYMYEQIAYKFERFAKDYPGIILYINQYSSCIEIAAFYKTTTTNTDDEKQGLPHADNNNLLLINDYICDAFKISIT